MPSSSRFAFSKIVDATSLRRPLPKKLGRTVKTAQAVLLAIAVCFSLGATDASSRSDNMSHRLMCTCGCAQLLGECDHAGCAQRSQELGELKAAIASGATDQEILSSFAAKYGATVLAAPTTHGFDLVAWVAPVAVFAAALLGTILLVRRWSAGRDHPAPAAAGDPSIDALREKVRRETDAGLDGGA
jgi:cytochrome c-type biogenesis protein CcmH/NrfF